MNVELLLSRLERVRPTGPGKWRADCPVGHSSRQTLSIAEATNGAVLVHCFSCGSGDHALSALGMSWFDLFPERARELSDAERRQWKESQRSAGWAAALRVLTFEGAVVMAAANDTLAGHPLSQLDSARLRLAIDRLTSARQRLAVPASEGSRYKGADEQAQAEAEQYRQDLERAA